MKNKSIFYFIFGIIGVLTCACSSGPSQGESDEKDLILATRANDSLIYETIEIWQDSTWDAIEREWLKKSYNPCLKKSKVKISCDDCTAVVIDAIFYVNGEGKLEKYVVERSSYCMKEEIEGCFVQYFYEMDFPKKYYNKSFRLRLGRALKC